MARHFQIAPPDGPVNSPLLRLLFWVDRLSPAQCYFLAAVMIVFIMFIDVITGPEIALSILYLAPVGMLAWHTTWTAARIGVLVSGLAWLVADIAAGASYSIAGIQYWNALVRTISFFIVAYTLHQLRTASREEHRLARTDTLTGVANSRMFVEHASLESARQRRYFHPLSIAFLDCDNFKRVNDLYGHPVGDELLRKIAVAITQALREVDVVARLGGDEFAILLPESDQKAAATVLRKLRNGLKAVGEQYNVTFSIGVVTYLRPAETVDQMLAAADKAMYEAKRAGKNTSRHKVYGRDDDEDRAQGVLPI
jgi:diguanylate cyclase (GGDEF)-like protein